MKCEKYYIFDCPECLCDETIVLKIYTDKKQWFKKIKCCVCKKIFDLPFTARDQKILG